MIFEAQKYSYIFSDRVYSMAVGLLVGMFHRLLELFLNKGKVKVFIKDVLTAVVFSLLLNSYVVSFANYKVLRWYNTAFALVGLLLFNPVFDNGIKTLLKLADITAVYTGKKTSAAAKRKIKEKAEKIKEKRQNFPTENSRELLQVDNKVLYN